MTLQKIQRALQNLNYLNIIVKDNSIEQIQWLPLGSQIRLVLENIWNKSLITSASASHIVPDAFNVANKTFSNIIRERQIFWTRLSLSNPQKYVVTDIQQHEQKNIQKVEILYKSKRLNEKLAIESVEFVSENNNSSCKFKPKLFSDSAVYSLLDESFNGDNEFHLNSQLAPIKIRLNYPSSVVSQDLKDLISLIEFKLHEKEITFITANDIDKENLYCLNTPFDLLVNEDLLKNGIMKLRSQKTRLTEEIHLSDIPDYLVNILDLK